MSTNLFVQNIIAMIWDFDKTLIPDYMQEPLFSHFQVDGKKFWDEVNKLPDFYKKINGLDHISRDSIYLNHILSYVRKGIFKDLNNQLLREFGTQLEFAPGLPDFFDFIKKYVETDDLYKKYDIKVEHYIISTGLRQIILGSEIAQYVDGIWACEFLENLALPGYLDAESLSSYEEYNTIQEIGYVIDNTSKTRALFEINKGTNKEPGIEINSSIKQEDRRIPFENMIYIADGPGDIPVFSVVNQNGGKTFAVYKPASKRDFAQANELQKQGRVQSFGPADYRQDSHTYMWLVNTVKAIANQIVENRKLTFTKKLGLPPGHIYKD